MIRLYEYTRQPRFWIAWCDGKGEGETPEDSGYWLVPAKTGGWAARHPFVGHVMNLPPLEDLEGIKLGLPGGNPA